MGRRRPPRSAYASGPTLKDEPNQKYRDAHVWYDSDNKNNFTAYKLLIADVVNGKPTAFGFSR